MEATVLPSQQFLWWKVRGKIQLKEKNTHVKNKVKWSKITFKFK